MAQLDFFMTEDETYSFLQLLIDEFDVRYIPEKNLSPDFPIFSKIDSIKKNDMKIGGKRYFIISKRWGDYSLQFKELNSKGYHYFYIQQRYGGPSFDFCYSKTYEENGKKWIVPGVFSNYPFYYLDGNSEKILKRPPSMAEAFKKIAAYLKKGSHQSRSVKKDFKRHL